MDRVRKQIGCDLAYERGITGKQIGIGVLDSGVALHPDLQGSIAEFRDCIYGKKKPYDDSGHGTFVCGVLCGNGLLSGGTYRGVAPDAGLYVAKVLQKNGDGDYDKLMEGLEWLLSNQEKFHLKVINISAGSRQNAKDDGSLARVRNVNALIRRAFELGVIVVTAAGNFGPAEGSISVIGSDRHAVSVGCHDGAFTFQNTKMCEEYSGRGPGRRMLKKPDIVAPGTEIVSCGLNGYTAKSGTSMATPLVAGALALAYERYPGMSARQMVQKLTHSAADLGEPWTKQGWGMLDIKRLLNL
ncbi:MAG: S8 family serine peptidase [Lachnospiraceae bacterium]|nr:S8 family serine peptidase [Lachnospiraceae bacterium]